MADNSLYVGRQDPMQALLQGFQGGQGIIGNITQGQMMNAKNAMMQRELEKQKAVSGALANYGQPGFDEAAAVKAVMPYDPELGIKINNLKRTATKEQIELLGAGASLSEKYAPILMQNPKAYPQFKQQMDAMGIGGALPEYQSFFDQQGQFNPQEYNKAMTWIAGGTKLIQEQLKPETFTYHPVQVGENVQGTMVGNKGTLNPIQGAMGPKHLTTPIPIVNTKTGEHTFISPKEGMTLPEGFQLASEYKVSLGRMDPSQRAELISAAKRGDITPSMLSKRGGQDYNALIADMAKEGISLTKLQTQFESARQFARTMNSQRFVNFYGYASTINNTIDRLGTLTDEMNLGGFRPVNYAEIKGKMELAGNTPAGQLATQYVTMVNGLKEEMAQVMNAGYAPTESVWKLVNEQINKNYGIDQMHSALGEVNRLIKYRVAAYQDLNPYQLQGQQFNIGQNPQEPIAQGQPQPQKLSGDQIRQFYNAKKTELTNSNDPNKSAKLKQLEDDYKVKMGGK